MRAAALALALILSAPALADRCGLSLRVGGSLIKAGDSEAQLLRKQEPDRTTQLETRQGGAAGYRHDYYRHGKTMMVYVRAGRVVDVCSVRD